jgi:DNA-binding response OmpR family regulator
MHVGPELPGHRILVVEDDYYIATDTARALQLAGAQVLGPCPNVAAAQAELTHAAPDAALLDINLGQGPCFALARELRERGVPFVFTTGYDRAVIPAEFADVPRLEKPVEINRVLGVLAAELGRA